MQKLSELRTAKWSIFTSKDDKFAVIKTAFTSEKVTPQTEQEKEKVEMLKIAIKVIEANTSSDVQSVIWQLQSSFDKYEDQKQKRKRKDICRRLIKSYQLECSTLPISALFEEEDAPLLHFYVQPMMQQVEYHKVRKQYKTVKSYNDIFHKDGQLCKKIYITGNAGTGKTAICQKMVLCWCHEQSAGKTDENFSEEDINIMKLFNYVFFVSLRDTEMCHVETMIQQQLLSTDKAELIDQILEDEKCLIILDGLDEWSHPKSATFCPIDKKIPHRKTRDSCIYLTTSRPWKLESNRLNTRQIDQQIELKGLDKRASDKLIAFVVDHLNKKYLKDRTPREFQEAIEKKKQVTGVSEIPVIKIQLISLWFQKTDLSTHFSRCEIYADTVEMLLSRAIEREGSQAVASRNSESVKQINTKTFEQEAPNTISRLTLLTEFCDLLYKIGHLAFDMLFSTPDGESSLVFKRNFGKNYNLSDIEIDFLLFVGILSKNKVIGPQHDRLIKLTFLHKSYQEFFAALYISMNKDIERIEKCIFSKCNSLAEFLRYEQMFVFLSGMNVKVMEAISDDVCNMVSADKDVKSYRQSAHYQFQFLVIRKPYNTLAGEMLEQGWNGEGALRCLQTLLMQCLEEGDCQGYKPALPLSDVFIGDEYTTELKRLLENNKRCIKSISTDVYISELTSLDMLEKLVVNEDTYLETCRVDIEQYENYIPTSSSTFVSLSLANCKGRFNVSTGRFTNLTSLALSDVILEHENIVEVFSFISNTVALTQLFLCEIKCCEHGNECSGGVLNLSNHSNLKYLRLQKLYEHGSHETKLNNESLQLLVIQDNTKGQIVKSVIEDIRNAPKLTEINILEFRTPISIDIILDTLPTLHCLERITFVDVDFGDRILQMNTENKQPLKMVNIYQATLTFQSFCRFVDSLPNKEAIVHIQACKITHVVDDCTTEIHMEDAAEYVRAKETFEVTFTGSGRLAFNSKS